ncbi:Zfp36l3 [Symbiodinium sp. CCMP2592]|nr:Zfp36l3 [Symbiodinium sp. CCMP2592]
MSKPEVVLQSLKNTRMCKFAETGRCRRGQACNFAHSEADLRPQPDLYSTRLCAQFSAGGCRYGRRCRFAHGEAELRPVINEVPEGQNQKGRSRGRQSQGYQANAAPVLDDLREMRPGAVRQGPNLGPCQGHLQGPAGWPEVVQEVPQLAPPAMLASRSQTDIPMFVGEDWTRRRPPRAPRLATDTTYNAQPSISELHPAVYPFARATTEGVRVPADRGDSRLPELAARLAAHGLPGSPGKGQHADRLFLDDPVSGGALQYRTETEEPTSCGTLASRTTTMQTESEAPAPPTSFWL